MARARCKGGLGFRDLHGFSLALLGKQVWRFCNNPSSLVARLFKARYFSANHILNADKGAGSSFVWNGIWEAKEQLRKGFRWILGDGKDVKIFQDPWLRGKNDYCVEDSHLNGIRNETVSCYFRPQSKEWDVHKVQREFHTDDVQFILQTRIPQNRVRDRVAWMASNTGEYSVKTGYQFWSSQLSNNTEVVISTGWNKLWKLRLPHKVRTFLWRFCNNTIPVRNLIRSKGIATTIMCPMCNVEIEHLLHVFFDCKFAPECWGKAGIMYDMQRVEAAPPWLLDKITNENAETSELIAKVLWEIWFARLMAKGFVDTSRSYHALKLRGHLMAKGFVDTSRSYHALKLRGHRHTFVVV